MMGLLMALLSGCAYSPGGHIEYEAEAEPIDDLVDIQAITPSLVRQMAPEASRAQRVSPGLRTQLADYQYRIGPGDVLSVVVYDHPELTIPAGSERSAAEAGNQVDAEGFIFYPYVGRVKVAGLTIEEVRSLLARRLAATLKEPQVEVRVAAYRSQKVYVSGAVETPGILPIDTLPMTIVDAIGRAGGATDNADWHNVILTRDGVDTRVSLYAMLREGDLSENRLLRDGDMLHVPTADDQTVVVMGQVLRPGAIGVGNERVNLTNALARAGGINESRAEPSGIFVLRPHAEGSEKVATVYQLDITNAANLTLGSRFTLQPKDVVYVTAAPLARWNNVISLLLPSVTLPGDAATTVDSYR